MSQYLRYFKKDTVRFCLLCMEKRLCEKTEDYNIALVFRPGNLHRLGHADLSDEGSFWFLVEKSTPHTDYKKGDPNILNDIAILHLERPVRLTNAIRPVCLPTPKTSAEKQAEVEDTNLEALKPAIFTSSLKFLLQGVSTSPLEFY